MTLIELATIRLTLEEFCKHLTDDSKVPVDMQDLEPEIMVFINKKIAAELAKGKDNGRPINQ